MGVYGYPSLEKPDMSERLLILDRDGVINEDSDGYIKNPGELIPIRGSIEAIARLYHCGVKLSVVTNQSGISRGMFSVEILDAMNRKIRELLAQHGARIEMIAFCPHLPGDNCRCRKPKPGLLLSSMERLGIGALQTTFVGDSLSDVEAAVLAGIRPWLVLTGKGKRTLESTSGLPEEVSVFADLSRAADHFLADGCSR